MATRMFKKRFVLYFILIALWLAAVLLWETDRNMVRRWIYPPKSWLVTASTKCGKNADGWLEQMINKLATQYDSPANQLVFVPVHGAAGTQSCVNGWSDTPFFSEKITDTTRFRFASLSKAVTFIGLVTGAKGTLENVEWMNSYFVHLVDLPTPQKDKRVSDIKISNLINHSAGFDRLKEPDPMFTSNMKPWCPYRTSTLGQIDLQYSPGEKHAYSNIGYCLAVEAYQAKNKINFFTHLEKDLNIKKYGIGFIDQEDSKISYNFMHQEFFDAEFKNKFDWYALRVPMGMSGNAKGLAQFFNDNWQALSYFQMMHDAKIACNEKIPDSCYDGFMQRQVINGNVLWTQRGYLFGMSSIFVMDKNGNMLIWLGSGEHKDKKQTNSYIEKTFIENMNLRK